VQSHLAAAAAGLDALPGVPGSGAKALPPPGDCRHSCAEPGVGGSPTAPATKSTISATPDVELQGTRPNISQKVKKHASPAHEWLVSKSETSTA